MPKVQDLSLTDQCNLIDQIGVICKDIDAAKTAMLAIFGVAPEVDYEKDYSLYYRGEPVEAQAKVCAYRYFDLEIEFIQPIGEGKTAWHDYLAMGQFGLHHIRFNVDNYEQARQLLLDKGLDIWIEGEGTGAPGLRYAYFDSLTDLGFAIEIINHRELH